MPANQFACAQHPHGERFGGAAVPKSAETSSGPVLNELMESGRQLQPEPRGVIDLLLQAVSQLCHSSEPAVLLESSRTAGRALPGRQSRCWPA